MLSSTSPREAVFARTPFPPSNLPSFTEESTLSSPCSRSTPLSRQGVVLAHLDFLPPHDLVLWTYGSVPFSFGKGGSGVVANCSLCGTEATLSFLAGPVCSSFSPEACPILHALLVSAASTSLLLLLLSDTCSVFSSIFLFISISVADLAGTVFSFLLFYQTTMGSRTLASPRGTTRLMSWPDG